MNTTPPSRRPTRPNWGRRALLILVPALVAGGWYAWRPAKPPATATASATDVTAAWLAALAPDEHVTLWLRQTGSELALSSRPVDISARADWADYRRSWRESSASELNAIAYRGQGTTRIVPDGSTVIDIALEIVSSPGGETIDSGNLQATVNANGATMDGRIWSNSAQAERPVRLTRVLPAK